MSISAITKGDDKEYRVDPTVHREFAKYGGETANKCFNCGHCTAVCSLTKDETIFPRQYIRYIQLGLTEKMLNSPEPWLCYYCGDCSDSCPRSAEPGEMMMAARRWLTSMYDWTGLGRLMYKSEAAEILILVAVALFVLIMFTVPASFGFRLLAQNPEALRTVDLEAFAPMHTVHMGDIVMVFVLGFFLLSNAFRMMLYVMKGSRVPLIAYILEFKEIVIHLLTQMRWGQCGKHATKHWVRHMVLVTGYATMFMLVVVFLPWFQIAGTDFHWTSLPGYYATVTLLGVSSWMLLDRSRKEDQIHKHSHLSDWMFPWLLLGTAATGILMHLFRLVDLALATYIIYVIHLMIAVPMLVVEVPFGKWAHLLYRPLAVYFTAVKQHDKVRKVTIPAYARQERSA